MNLSKIGRAKQCRNVCARNRVFSCHVVSHSSFLQTTRPLLWAIHCCQPPPFPHNSPAHIFKFLRRSQVGLGYLCGEFLRQTRTGYTSYVLQRLRAISPGNLLFRSTNNCALVYRNRLQHYDIYPISNSGLPRDAYPSNRIRDQR